MKRRMTGLLITLVMLGALCFDALAVFEDVPAYHWASEEIRYVTDRGLFQGVSPSIFAPKEGMTRGALAAVLHRHAGTPKPERAVSYSDIPPERYYFDAVRWAHENGIFTAERQESQILRPDQTVTRGEFAVMLYHYHLTRGGASVEPSADMFFPDMENATPEEREAILCWAYPLGILRGTEAGKMNPSCPLTRAHVAVMLFRYDQAVGVTVRPVDEIPDSPMEQTGADSSENTATESEKPSEYGRADTAAPSQSAPAESGPESMDANLDIRLEIVRLANEVRKKHGSRQAAVSQVLMDSAQAFAQTKPIEHDVFRECAVRREYGCYHGVGCNLYAIPCNDPSAVAKIAVEGWEKSYYHCVAMVNNGADSIGIGAYLAPGTNTYYCVMFVGDCISGAKIFGNPHD